MGQGFKCFNLLSQRRKVPFGLNLSRRHRIRGNNAIGILKDGNQSNDEPSEWKSSQ